MQQKRHIRAGTYFQHKRATAGTNLIDRGNVPPHRFGGLYGSFTLLVGQFDRCTLAALVKIRAKIIVKTLALHTGKHPALLAVVATLWKVNGVRRRPEPVRPPEPGPAAAHRDGWPARQSRLTGCPPASTTVECLWR